MTSVIELAKKLHAANETLRQLWGDTYEEQIHPWRQALRAIRSVTGEDIAHTTLRALQSANGSGQALALCAAAVDLMMMEPDDASAQRFTPQAGR